MSKIKHKDKLNIQKTKIMTSDPITLWQIDEETMETVTDFIFGGSKITADGDWSHVIKRCLLPGRKVMTSLDSRLKRRNITLPTKVCLVKAMVFPVVMYGCESWTFKKVEGRRIDKALESPLEGREIKPVHPKGNHSRIFIGRTDVEAETPILWPPDAKNWLIWKDPDARKDWRWKEKGTTEGGMVGGITDSMDMSWVNCGIWWWTGRPGVLQSMGSQRATKLNWTTKRIENQYDKMLTWIVPISHLHDYIYILNFLFFCLPNFLFVLFFYNEVVLLL